MENLCIRTCIFLSAKCRIGRFFRKVKKYVILRKVKNLSSIESLFYTKRYNQLV